MDYFPSSLVGSCSFRVQNRLGEKTSKQRRVQRLFELGDEVVEAVTFLGIDTRGCCPPLLTVQFRKAQKGFAAAPLQSTKGRARAS